LTLSGILLSSTTSSLAEVLHITQSTAGLTILSIATTLPEKFVAFKSGRKAQAGVLVANTVGSNIFLMTLALGITWISHGHMPMMENEYVHGRWIWVDLGVVMCSSALLLGIVWLDRLERWMGIAMFAGYSVYIVSVLFRQ
jgi:Ca2+/Na+ antiporter